MSGHSKWATIKRKKGALDAKRGKIFTKLIKEIMVAARMGGGDPEMNPRLRTVVLKARAANMPKDNIDRAIKKGLGEGDGATYVELVYEGYAPGGVAIMVETLTDNKNRTAADVRSIFTKNGGNLGESGCVSYMFKRKGIISFDAERFQEDAILECALEAGADDVVSSDGTIDVTCSPESFELVLDSLQKGGFEQDSAEITLLADTMVSCDKETTLKALKMIDLLEDNDDVQNVSSHMEIPEGMDLDV